MVFGRWRLGCLASKVGVLQATRHCALVGCGLAVSCPGPGPGSEQALWEEQNEERNEYLLSAEGAGVCAVLIRSLLLLFIFHVFLYLFTCKGVGHWARHFLHCPGSFVLKNWTEM